MPPPSADSVEVVDFIAKSLLNLGICRTMSEAQAKAAPFSMTGDMLYQLDEADWKSELGIHGQYIWRRLHGSIYGYVS